MKNITEQEMVNGEPSYLTAPIHFGNVDEVEPGTMCFANASRFVESNFNVPLTTYAAGWKDPNRIDQALEFVAPMVSVGRSFTYMVATNQEEFVSETDDLRGIGADFKRIEYTSSKVLGKTINKGLTMKIDMDEVNDLPNFEEIYTGRMMRRLLRNEFRRAVNVLVAAAVANATAAPYLNPENKTWNQTAGLDPDQDLIDMTNRYMVGAGIPPNRALFGKFAWSARQRALRFQNNPGGFMSASMTPEQLAAFLMLDQIYVSREMFTTGTRLTPSKVPIAGTTLTGLTPNANPVVMFLAEAGQTPEDPSNMKRFVSATEGGTPFRVYVQPEGSKFRLITVEHYSVTVATSTVGIQLLNVLTQ